MSEMELTMSGRGKFLVGQLYHEDSRYISGYLNQVRDFGSLEARDYFTSVLLRLSATTFIYEDIKASCELC